eukprot:SAG31_NODE_21993_length_536_cov_0.881007_1_plen_122_part_00
MDDVDEQIEGFLKTMPSDCAATALGDFNTAITTNGEPENRRAFLMGILKRVTQNSDTTAPQITRGGVGSLREDSGASKGGKGGKSGKHGKGGKGYKGGRGRGRSGGRHGGSTWAQLSDWGG